MKLMEKMALISQGWSGGTRIGEALAAFNDRYASAIMNSRTLAIIVSDGFDTGPAGQLAAELATPEAPDQALSLAEPALGPGVL